jgi:ABC-2 type transport system ATP-binding protein
MSVAIQMRGLHKTFRVGLRRRPTAALRGLDLEVGAGEVFGFLGPNGAGKTTAIKILVGLLRADRGEALLFGTPATEVAARRTLAYLPELPDFYDYLRPGELLRHCGRLSGIPAADLRRRVPELLSRVGLSPDERRPIRKFSKGMLQRLGLAQTLLADPQLYILDEPMSGLDPLGRRWVKDLILELGRQGKTVFFSSHILSEAEAVCHRVAFIHQGQVVAQGALAEVLRGQGAIWEILLAGEGARADAEVARLGGRVEPSGPDSLLSLPPGQTPEGVLPVLLARGHRLLSVTPRHASLEEAFIRIITQRKEG